MRSLSTPAKTTARAITEKSPRVHPADLKAITTNIAAITTTAKKQPFREVVFITGRH
ncbi:MAG: hypothetical protein NVSMB31_14550 [Vulcanimicrobiaceae bacterium]